LNKQLIKEIKSLEKGDYVKVTWYDANDARGSLSELKRPEVLVDEWGVFLGIEGLPKHILLGKNYVHSEHVWEATCIPVTLIRNVELVIKHADRSPRRFRVEPCRQNVVRVKGFG